MCHSKVKYNILQEFLEPGLLIKNKKVGFRMYLVIFYQFNKLNAYLYKDGICYYSKNDYNSNTDLNNNVVSSIFKIKDFIKENNLPLFFQDFINYIQQNYNISNDKINYFINELINKCKILINSVKDKIIYLNQTNIKEFAIYGLDVEYDKHFNPYIFEGNVYFSRFDKHKDYSNLISDLYNDIFFKLNISTKNINGWYNIL